MKRYEMELDEIRHPEKVEDYPVYKEHSYRICAWGHPIVKIYRHLEVSVYKIKNGNIKAAVRDIMDDIYRIVKKLSS